MMGIDETPAVRNGNIELAVVAQAAADLGQMRALLSTRKMLDDVVGYDEVEAPVLKREFGPAYLGELISRTDPFCLVDTDGESTGFAESQLGEIGWNVIGARPEIEHGGTGRRSDDSR
jgi:hypothetical protein